MIRVLAAASLVALGTTLIACKPTPELPLTGEISLTYVSSTTTELRFRLANQTTHGVSFSGGDSFLTDSYPWETKIHCWNPRGEAWTEAQSGTSHAHSDDIEVPSGEQMFVAVNWERAQRKIGAVPGTRCMLLLSLQGAATPILSSNEFEL